MNEHQQKRLNEAPAIYANAISKAYQGKSKSAAIKAFCPQCTGYERATVRDCTSYACPLFDY